MSTDQSEFGDFRTIPKRKIRHLQTLSIHNLTSTPHRDELLSLPLVKPTDSLTTGYNTPQRKASQEEYGEEEHDVSEQVVGGSGSNATGGNIVRKSRRRMTLDDLELLTISGRRGRRISVGSAKSSREPSISTTPSFSAQLSSSPSAMLHLPSTTSHQPRRPSLSRARTSSRLLIPSSSMSYLSSACHPSPTMDLPSSPSSPFLSNSLNTLSEGRPRSSSRVSIGSSCSDRTVKSIGPGYNFSDHSRIEESKEEIEPDSSLIDKRFTMHSLEPHAEPEENDPLVLASSRLLESFVVLSLVEDTIQSCISSSKGSIKGKEKATPTMIPASRSVDSAFSRQAQPVSYKTGSSTVHQNNVSLLASPTMYQPGSANGNGVSSSGKYEPVPFFISRIQQASTHPLYGEFDPEHDFSDEMGSFVGRLTVFKVEVFVRQGRRKGGNEEGWRVLKSWKVNLEKLKIWNGKSFLPPNTLIMTLNSHPNALYYLPSPLASSSEIPVLTRNVSDGELNLLPLKDAQKKRGKVLGRAGWDGVTERSVLEKSLRETKMKRGTGIGELLKLVNLQFVLEDTRQSTRAIEAGLNKLIEKDNKVAGMVRDLNEKENRIHRLRELTKRKEQSRDELKRRIEEYQHNIQRREELLQAGEACLVEERAHIAEINSFSHTMTANRHALRPYFQYHRSRLTSTLEGIFPIGPKVHNRALVFTILDVALPTPFDKEPAPPLHLAVEDLPAGTQVDEQSIAAALGYVTMLVHLLAKYLRKGLVYPLTPAQSRSLVKDPVSDMQGPTRMFPLYSKGVAKYRFEYAVHLLNKDIELLMTDRNLKTVDLRHTLANLMNLLLTISSSHIDSPGSIASLPPLSTLSSLKTESHSLGPGSSLTCHRHRHSHVSNGSMDGDLTMTTSVGGSTYGDNSVVSEEEKEKEGRAEDERKAGSNGKGERKENERAGRKWSRAESEIDGPESQTSRRADGSGPVGPTQPGKMMNEAPSRVAIDGLPGLS